VMFLAATAGSAIPASNNRSANFRIAKSRCRLTGNLRSS
jgi:hypothetical protein